MSSRRTLSILSLAAAFTLAAGAVAQIRPRPIAGVTPVDRSTRKLDEAGGKLVTVVSRLAQAGVPREIALPVDGTGIEPRTTGGKVALVFNFDRPARGGVATVTAGKATLDGAVTVEAGSLVVKLKNVEDLQSVAVALSKVAFADDSVGKAAFNFRTLEGDSNADGVVDETDLLLVKSALRTAYRPAQTRLDVNVTGSVTSTDASRLSRLSGRTVLGGKQTNTPPDDGNRARRRGASGQDVRPDHLRRRRRREPGRPARRLGR